MRVPSLFVRQQFLGATRRSTQDDAALRGPNEIDHELHFFAREGAIALELGVALIAALDPVRAAAGTAGGAAGRVLRRRGSALGAAADGPRAASPANA